MKQILLLPILLLFATLTYAQKDTSVFYTYYPGMINSGIEDGHVPYLVGSAFIPGYNIEMRTCADDESVTLSNGRRIAGLSCILLDKHDYVGGKLIFKNDTTNIVDVSIIPVGEDAKFIVKGEDFSMEFTLTNGTILKLEDTHTVFNTDGTGIWTIVKKA